MCTPKWSFRRSGAPLNRFRQFPVSGFHSSKIMLPYVEAWILDESPRFRTAYEAYYQASVKKNAIPLFATTHMDRCVAAENYFVSVMILLPARSTHLHSSAPAIAR